MTKQCKYVSALLFTLIFWKIDAQPNFSWAKAVVQGEDSERVIDLCVDPFGNVITVGVCKGIIDLDPGPLYQEYVSNVFEDFYVQKFDTSGDLLWARTFGGGEGDYGLAVQTDADGNVFVCGHFQWTVDFDPGFEEHLVTAEVETDAYLLKMNPEGEFLWVKTFASDHFAYGFDVTIDDLGSCYLVGSYIGEEIDLDPGSEEDIHYNDGGRDLYIVKLDSDGEYIWGKTIQGEGSTDPYGVCLDPSGNVLITGYFIGISDFDPGEESFFMTSHTKRDVFIEKLDTEGNLVWVKSYGGDHAQEASAIDVDANGNIFISGHFFNTSDFDPGPDVYEMTAVGDGSIELDGYLQKLDADGNLLWVHQYGGDEFDKVRNLVVGAEGNVFVTGYYTNTVDVDHTDEEWWLEGTGHKDIFLLKLTNDGELLWADRCGGAGEDRSYAIGLDDVGNIFLAGSFKETVDFDSTVYDTATITALGKDDAFLMKLSQWEVGVPEIRTDNPVKLYPNPTNGFSYIQFDTIEENVTVSLKNVLGQELFYQLYQHTHTITLDCPVGISFVEIRRTNGTLVQTKIIRN